MPRYPFPINTVGQSRGPSNSLTINNTTVSPTLLYEGRSASSSGWPATIGSSLTKVEVGIDVIPGIQTPFKGRTKGVEFQGEDYFSTTPTNFQGIGTNDFALELLVKFQSDTTSGLLGANATGGFVVGNNSNSYSCTINDGTNTAACATGTLVDDTWYHIMWFCNRDEASTNGFQAYVDGVASGTGIDPSDVSNAVNPATAFLVGLYAGQNRSIDTLARACLWQASNWHAAGSAGPTEWADIAAARYAAWTN